MGADAFRALPGWHRWQELTGLAHGGDDPAEAAHWTSSTRGCTEAMVGRWTDLVERLHNEPCGRVMVVRVTPLAISSSLIRASLAAGRSPRFLLPQPVLEHIHARGLYRPDEA